LSVQFTGFDCNFDRYCSISIAARKITGAIVLAVVCTQWLTQLREIIQ
jgi:hypothetical protein